MTIHPDTIGIDVCKHHLDVFDPRRGRPYRVANTPAEAGKLAAGIAERQGLAVFEATGRYDAHLRLAFQAAGASHARVNPKQARDFAQAIGRRAKTDAVDARMLAELGWRLAPRPRAASDADRERLRLMMRRRDQLVAMRQQEQVRRKEETQDALLILSLDAHLAWLGAEIARHEASIHAFLRDKIELRRDETLMRSVPGVGAIVAKLALAIMPELGALTPKTAAALAGLAPFNNDSGRFQGKRSVSGGRKRIRDALYMAALSAARTHTRLGDFYRALVNAGKPKKLALVALARKIIVILNAVMRDKTPFKTA